jgi:hypothetical protein
MFVTKKSNVRAVLFWVSGEAWQGSGLPTAQAERQHGYLI